MADDVTVTLKGDKDCLASFKELREYVRGNPFRQAVRAAARIMMEEIIVRAPVATGRLVSNIRIALKATYATVRARVSINTSGKADDAHNAFYWRFVEFGHRINAGGGVGFVQPQPFVTPAFESRKAESAQVVITDFEKALGRAERRAARASIS